MIGRNTINFPPPAPVGALDIPSMIKPKYPIKISAPKMYDATKIDFGKNPTSFNSWSAPHLIHLCLSTIAPFSEIELPCPWFADLLC